MVEPKTNSTARIGANETTAPRGAQTATDGVAFKALLERLERDAHALERDSQRVQGPQALAGAVDRAHASLQDVLSLGDQLLEAYREALARQSGARDGRP
ncbi:MAG: hypothetical protein HZA53_16805 [Planctomycetes bacterium]|nr:hypothetical protein [Planctomycetota bacterium]